mgnify:CR=1 FL=1
MQDWLLQRMSARYVDLDDSQKKALRTRLSRLHAGTGRRQLPLYADLLDPDAPTGSASGPADIDLDGALDPRTPPGRNCGRGPGSSPRCSDVVPGAARHRSRRRWHGTTRASPKTQLGPDPAAQVHGENAMAQRQVERWTGKLTRDTARGHRPAGLLHAGLSRSLHGWRNGGGGKHRCCS